MPRLGATLTLGLGFSLVGLLLAAASGRWPGMAELLASVVAITYFAQIADSPEVHRKANTVPVILALISAGSIPSSLSISSASVSLLTIKLLLAQVYLAAGISKLRQTGWSWRDGNTLRRWFVYYYLRDGSLPCLRLASSVRACRALSTVFLIFELTFWLVVPFPFLAWIFVPFAVLFHLGTAMLMRIHYWIYLGPAFLVFPAPSLPHSF